MNNHNPHNHNEQRPNKRPFKYIVSRGLLHRENERNNATQHRSAIPEYQITIEHGSIWLGQDCVASSQAMR